MVTRLWILIGAALVIGCAALNSNVAMQPQLTTPAQAAIAPKVVFEQLHSISDDKPSAAESLQFMIAKAPWDTRFETPDDASPIWSSLSKPVRKKVHKKPAASLPRPVSTSKISEEVWWSALSDDEQYDVAKVYHDKVCPWLEEPRFIMHSVFVAGAKVWLRHHSSEEAKVKLRSECPPRPPNYAQNEH